MESVLASLTVGVAVVDEGLNVSAWNSPAQELWGVQADEAVGRSLFSLDIGLPLGRLRTQLDSMLAGPHDKHSAVLVDAVNRRGRPVTVQVTLSPLVRDDDAEHKVTGAILVMEEMKDGSKTV